MASKSTDPYIRCITLIKNKDMIGMFQEAFVLGFCRASMIYNESLTDTTQIPSIPSLGRGLRTHHFYQLDDTLADSLKQLQNLLKSRGYRTTSKSKQKPGRIWKDEELSPKKLAAVQKLRAQGLSVTVVGVNKTVRAGRGKAA